MEIQALLLVAAVASVCGHGRLMEPPGRSSAWRFGFNTPRNYNDNELFCGGFGYQQTVGMKCGICGDPYGGYGDNEAGGRYATGTIVRHYQEGEMIDINVELTASHKGYFEFRLCENNDVTKKATQECLDQHILVLGNGQTRWQIKTFGAQWIKTKGKLPVGLTCTQCVLQWKYNAGNSYGTDIVTGKSCVGCGLQEQFYGCADISIRESGTTQRSLMSSPATHQEKTTVKTTTLPSEKTTIIMTTLPPVKTTVKTTTLPPVKTTTVPSVKTTVKTKTTSNIIEIGGGCKAVGAWKGDSKMDSWCITNCALGNCPSSHCQCTTTTLPPVKTTTDNVVVTGGCKAVGAWKGDSKMDSWCKDNCAVGNCPSSHCQCTTGTTTLPPVKTTTDNVVVTGGCIAVGAWKGDSNMNSWCKDNCAAGNCPASHCKCTSVS